MFSSNRGLFPAYSGLGDIEVSLPTPPSRSSIARDVEDLWEIHTESPHVDAPSDPGISVPYPDDGFNPSRNLSEDSEANILVNRASQPLTSDARKKLLSKLNDLYTDRLVTNLQMSGMSPSAIKEMMQTQCAGSLLVYNGNDRDCLIKAFTLVKSLEHLVENFVRNSTFSEDAKAEMLSFVSPCPSVRDALVLPEHIIRQRLFGSTESRDHITHALSIFGLNDDEIAVGKRQNPLDEEFVDYLEKIDFAELELDRAIQQDMVSGDSHNAMYNALNQVLPSIYSSDLKNALTSTIMSVRRDAEDQCRKTSKSLALLLAKLKKDLEQIGVDPRSVDALMEKEALHRKESQAALTTPSDSNRVMSSKSNRSPREITVVSHNLDTLVQNLKNSFSSTQMHPRAKLCCAVELYTIMCLRDCCAALAAGDELSVCADRLKSAIEAELKASQIPHIKSLNSQVVRAHKDLQSARKSKTMDSLTRAQSESLISDKKLETLRQIIG